MKKENKEGKGISRRQFIGTSLSLATGMAVGAKAAFGAPTILKKLARPNSEIAGVKIGAITYSYWRMGDRTAESMLQALVNSGIGYTELMGGEAESFAGIPENESNISGFQLRSMRQQAEDGELNDEQMRELEEMEAQLATQEERVKEWRATVSMDRFVELRTMYNDAGVEIYAWKPSVFGNDNTDEEMEYGFRVARVLGATHCTRELPDDPALSARIGAIAEQYEIYMDYHNHTQATPTLWDTALGQSPYNAINLDIGHYVAAGYDPIPFIEQHHERIHSMHLKDRTTPANGADNLMWGQGDTPIAEVLQLVRDEDYNIIPTVELEYDTPDGSDAVAEVARCLEYCRTALTS